eukprot:PhF_6_TR17420/c0_g1_i1/m.26660
MSRRVPPPPPMLPEDLEDDADSSPFNSVSLYELSASGQTFSFANMYTITRDGLIMDVKADGESEDHAQFIHFEDLDLENAVEIGRGASAQVLQCNHTPTGMMVVLKKVGVAESHQRNEIKRELDMLSSKLGYSRFIVRFYGAFYDNGFVYIALERLHASLADCLKITKVIPETVLRCATRHALQAFVFLHEEHRRIHRDIKPSNLLFSSQGDLKVADFGVTSETLSSIINAQTFLGTLTYMSPERLQGVGYRFSADIWSLGMTLLECLTGSHPYKNPTSSPLPSTSQFFEIYTIVSQDGFAESVLSKASTAQNPVSPECMDFVKRCLRKDPTEREGALSLLCHPWVRELEDPVAEARAKEDVKGWLDMFITNDKLKRARLNIVSAETKGKSLDCLSSAFSALSPTKKEKP